MSTTTLAVPDSPAVAGDREFTLLEAHADGWPGPDTLRKRIKQGRLAAERTDDRGTLVVRESDLLRQPDLVRLRRAREATRPAPSPVSAVPTSTDNGLDDLAALVARMVAGWPWFTAERKAELGRMLAS